MGQTPARRLSQSVIDLLECYKMKDNYIHALKHLIRLTLRGRPSGAGGAWHAECQAHSTDAECSGQMLTCRWRSTDMTRRKRPGFSPVSC